MRKQENVMAKTTAGIGMQLSKREHMLIKDNIARDIDTACFKIQALDSFVKRAISKKHTTGGSKSKFAFVVGSKIGPASTKNTKRFIVGFGIEKFFSRAHVVENFGRKQINEICGG